jgi:hypothetical protein
MKRNVLSIFGYIVASFLVQGLSHFVFFAKHYAAVPIFKAQPIFAFGLSSMAIQGVILTFLFKGSRFHTGRLFDAIRFGWCFGAFLVSYIALGESGKYAVPDVPSWIGVEALAGLLQFTLIGLFTGLVFRRAEIQSLS